MRLLLLRLEPQHDATLSIFRLAHVGFTDMNSIQIEICTNIYMHLYGLPFIGLYY